MKDTRPINMLILTVFIVALTAFAVAATSLARPRAGVEIRRVNRDGVLPDLALDTLQDEIFHPAALRLFDKLTTLSAQVCRASAQTHAGLVRFASGRLPGVHSITIQPWAVICSVSTA